MCGPPASGKSTYAQILEDKNTILVSRDKIRFHYLEHSNHPYFDYEDTVYSEYVKGIQNALNSGKNVIADATHLTVNSRARLLNHLELNQNIEVVALNFKTSKEDCIERNSKRTGLAHVPENVISDMFERYVFASAEEKHIDKVEYINS